MIQDGVIAGLLPHHPLETRLAAVIETAISTYFDALDDEDKASAKLYVQKAAQQMRHGSKQLEVCRGLVSQTRKYQPSNTPAPPPLMKIARIWISQRPGRADSVRRS